MMVSSKTYSVKLSYRELEMLVRALHSGNAELYCAKADTLMEPDERALAEADDQADMDLCENLRDRICGVLNRIDAAAATQERRAAA